MGVISLLYYQGCFREGVLEQRFPFIERLPDDILRMIIDYVPKSARSLKLTSRAMRGRVDTYHLRAEGYRRQASERKKVSLLARDERHSPFELLFTEMSGEIIEQIPESVFSLRSSSRLLNVCVDEYVVQKVDRPYAKGVRVDKIYRAFLKERSHRRMRQMLTDTLQDKYACYSRIIQPRFPIIEKISDDLLRKVLDYAPEAVHNIKLTSRTLRESVEQCAPRAEEIRLQNKKMKKDALLMRPESLAPFELLLAEMSGAIIERAPEAVFALRATSRLLNLSVDEYVMREVGRPHAFGERLDRFYRAFLKKRSSRRMKEMLNDTLQNRGARYSRIIQPRFPIIEKLPDDLLRIVLDYIPESARNIQLTSRTLRDSVERWATRVETTRLQESERQRGELLGTVGSLSPFELLPAELTWAIIGKVPEAIYKLRSTSRLIKWCADEFVLRKMGRPLVRGLRVDDFCRVSPRAPSIRTFAQYRYTRVSLIMAVSEAALFGLQCKLRENEEGRFKLAKGDRGNGLRSYELEWENSNEKTNKRVIKFVRKFLLKSLANVEIASFCYETRRICYQLLKDVTILYLRVFANDGPESLVDYLTDNKKVESLHLLVRDNRSGISRKRDLYKLTHLVRALHLEQLDYNSETNRDKTFLGLRNVCWTYTISNMFAGMPRKQPRMTKLLLENHLCPTYLDDIFASLAKNLSRRSEKIWFMSSCSSPIPIFNSITSKKEYTVKTNLEQSAISIKHVSRVNEEFYDFEEKLILPRISEV